MPMEALLVFVAALAVNSGSPGPSVAALVSRVLHSGWKSVLPFLAAMWIGEALWLAAAIAGLSALAHTFHYAFALLKYLGCIYLLYLAWGMWTNASGGQDGRLPKEQSGWRLFASGMALTIGNPKIIVFYLALLPGLVSVATISALAWMQLTFALLVVLASVDLAWVATASLARNVLRSPAAVKATNRVGAGMMTGAAVFIASRD